jgi:hypothetical protein
LGLAERASKRVQQLQVGLQMLILAEALAQAVDLTLAEFRGQQIFLSLQ